MSSNFTRRTHIVRISDANADNGEKPEDGNYIDVEVLDAIAFRIEGGKEVVLKTTGGKAFIDDQTDGDHGKRPGNASRRSHIKRIKGDDGSELDVETIECAAFTDQNGGEWILNMKDPGNVVDTTDGGGGGSGNTRRGHSEKITAPFGQGKKASSYVTMQRHDMIAFRKEGGKEVILKAPSSDDPQKPENPRADTFLVKPDKYDPNDEKQKVDKNEDENVYFAFVKDKSADPSDGPQSKKFLTGDTKIVTGPLWWIRKINTKGGLLEVDYIITGPGTNPPNGTLPVTIEGFASPDSEPISLVNAKIDFPLTKDPPPVPSVNQKITDEMLAFYHYWTNQAPVGPRIIPGSPAGPGTFIVWADGYPYPPTDPNRSGLMGSYPDEASAEAAAAFFNADFPGRIIGYIDGNTGQPDFLPIQIPIYSGGSLPCHIIVIPGGAEPASYRYRGSQIFNLKNLKPADAKNQKTFKLKINVPSTSTVAFSFILRTYKTKHRDFTTDPKGKPTWDKGDEVDKFGFNGVGSVDTHISAFSFEIEIDAAKLTFKSARPSSITPEEHPDADA